jgi:aspartyl-tRNA(Asn)/glutamyl-tRNA(Gln) amidotransferase subunit B
MSLNYDGALEIYEPTLGLEVHVELNTNSKMSWTSWLTTGG